MTTTPDGFQLRVAGQQGQWMGSWAFMFETNSASGPVRMHTGAVGSLEATETHLGTLETYRRREVHQGPVLIVALEAKDPALTTFLWQGPHHELSATVGGTDVPFEAFLDLLEPFSVLDGEDGIRLRPKAGSGNAVRLLLGANSITGVCAVTVKPVAAVRRNLPRHAGKAVPGGVLWQETEQMPAGPMRRAIIANNTAAVVLETDQPDDDAFVEVVNSITVDLDRVA